MIGNQIMPAHRDAWFETLFLRARGRIYRVAYGTLRNAEDAEDVTQEVMIRAWPRLSGFQSDPGRDTERILMAWLNRIAQNLAIDTLRRRNRRAAVSLNAPIDLDSDGKEVFPEVADPTQDPIKQYLLKDESERVKKAISRLGSEYQSCLWLLTEEHSYKEISALLNCPFATVRSRIHRARISLRNTLQPEQGREMEQ